jgi:hypothetical protein
MGNVFLTGKPTSKKAIKIDYFILLLNNVAMLLVNLPPSAICPGVPLSPLYTTLVSGLVNG